jgi:hypothetical protein
MSSLNDDIAAETRRHQPTPARDRLRAELSEDDFAALLDAIDDTKVPVLAIHRALRRRGVGVDYNVLIRMRAERREPR